MKDYDQIIRDYNDLRELVYDAIYAKPELMGKDQWLRYAITEYDINLGSYREGFIDVSGRCYTNDTMSNEFFDFQIPIEELNDVR